MKQPIVKQYIAALYMRLSHDDELQGDSSSIQTQRVILQKYAKEQGFVVFDEYVDDGWSGTNFDRPGFQRMLNDIEDGKINCVVTKDLSRLGRNYVLTGQYIEIYFPSKGIRYIAINDNVDTLKGDSEIAPFLNILNEMHAKQTSKKVKTALRAKYENGLYHCTLVPLGYKKDPEKKGHLIIDEDTSWIVIEIFSLITQGYGLNEIRRKFYKDKVPTAGWIYYQKYGRFKKNYENAPIEKRYKWTIKYIRDIIKNEVYLGHSVHYKTEKASFKSKKVVKRDPSEWMIIKNTHEALVTEEMFKKANETLNSRKKVSSTTGEVDIFGGLLKCADCGWSLKVGRYKSRVNSSVRKFYNCGKYSTLNKPFCTIHYINYSVLYDYVLSRLQYWFRLVHTDEKRLLEVAKKNKLGKDSSKYSLIQKELRDAKKRRKAVDELFIKLYEDRAAGILMESNYSMLIQKYQKEQDELDEKIEILSNQCNLAEKEILNIQELADLIKKYSEPTKLTRELLNTFIDKILVHEAVKDEDGNRIQEIEIYYRFAGRLDNLYL